MKKNLLIFLLLGYTYIGLSQNFTPNQGAANKKDYFSVIPYDDENGFIIVPVEIKGKQYRFLLDTGAITSISEELQNELNAEKTDITMVVDQSGIFRFMDIVKLKEINFGGVTFEEIPAIVKKPNLIMDCFETDGVIGSNLLRKSVVRISPKDRTITLTNNSKNLKLDKKQSNKITLDKQSTPLLRISLTNGNGKKMKQQVLFDTGMRAGNLFAFTDIYRSLTEKGIARESVSSRGASTVGAFGVAKDTIIHRARIPVMEMNGISFKNVLVQSSTERNIIGLKVLNNAVTTIDFVKKRIYFEPIAEKEVDLFEKRLPISIIYRDDNFIVGAVWDETLKGVISIGDKVMYIDDVDFSRLSVCDLYTKKQFPKAKYKFNLVVQKPDGSIHKIEIEKK